MSKGLLQQLGYSLGDTDKIEIRLGKNDDADMYLVSTRHGHYRYIVGLSTDGRLVSLDFSTQSDIQESLASPMTRQEAEAKAIAVMKLSLTPAEFQQEGWRVESVDTEVENLVNNISVPIWNVFLQRQITGMQVSGTGGHVDIDQQSGKVLRYSMTNGIVLPQESPLISESAARALAWNVFIQCGGVPTAVCTNPYSGAAWHPITQSPVRILRLGFEYGFEFRTPEMPADEMGPVYGVRIDAQTGTVAGIGWMTGGGGAIVAKVAPKFTPRTGKENTYLKMAADIAKMKGLLPLGRVAMSVGKPKVSPGRFKAFESVESGPERWLFVWENKNRSVWLSDDAGKTWRGGRTSESEAKIFEKWIVGRKTPKK